MSFRGRRENPTPKNVLVSFPYRRLACHMQSKISREELENQRQLLVDLRHEIGELKSIHQAGVVGSKGGGTRGGYGTAMPASEFFKQGADFIKATKCDDRVRVCPGRFVDFDRHRWCRRQRRANCLQLPSGCWTGFLFYVCMGLEVASDDTAVVRRLKQQQYLRPFRVHVPRSCPCPPMQHLLFKLVVALYCRSGEKGASILACEASRSFVALFAGSDAFRILCYPSIPEARTGGTAAVAEAPPAGKLTSEQHVRIQQVNNITWADTTYVLIQYVVNAPTRDDECSPCVRTTAYQEFDTAIAYQQVISMCEPEVS